jgi:hypothetical protein
MPIISVILDEIRAKKEKDITGQINVNNRTDIKDVEETDVPAIDKKCISVKFEFKTDYLQGKAKLGEILLKGSVILLERNKNKILELWKKEKRLPHDINIQVINAILRRCLIKSISLSEDLQLPPPIPLPIARIQTSKGDARYIG